ncbi:MAG: hypothetical protein MZV65_12435 [Chromatiales bacterium]|nr:hypothetical protein [Chromatiales bacterium]
MNAQLPEEIAKHLPNGYQPTPGVWLVLPESDGVRDGINTVNSWLRAEDWYPTSLQNIIWFGDDGTGNFLGWDPKSSRALLWNPEDGEKPWKVGSVAMLWQFIESGYKDAT